LGDENIDIIAFFLLVVVAKKNHVFHWLKSGTTFCQDNLVTIILKLIKLLPEFFGGCS